MRILNRIKWQISLIIFFIFSILSAVSFFLTFRYMNRTLTETLLDEGRVIAQNISELSAEKLIEDDIVGLKSNIEKYKYYMNIEYILIEDFNNQIKTDTYNGKIPAAVLKVPFPASFTGSEHRQHPVIQYLDTLRVYDITQPIKDGLLGFVRVGVQKSYMDQKIRKLAGFLLLVFLSATFLAITLALFIITLQFSKPIAYLTAMAQKISMGDFNTPVKLNTKNEIGVLGEAIERMRESLKTSIERLRKR